MIWDDSTTGNRAVEPLSFRSAENRTEVMEPAQAPDVSTPVDAMPMVTELNLREAHERGQREEREALHEEMEQRLAEERANISLAIQQFEQEKQQYFSQVEGEVIRLSLAIAERVLHREAEMDPTLLIGAARVALEQVADGSQTVLRVPAEEAQRWNDTLRVAANKVLIEPDEQLEHGEAVLKTQSGSMQLGLKAQLQEIERGFFDLLRCRPSLAM